MTDRPINFRPHQVRAALEGRLSQMRLVMEPQPKIFPSLAPSFEWGRFAGMWPDDWFGCGGGIDAALPYAPGDRLWVREAWGNWRAGEIVCREDYELDDPIKWRSPVTMPRRKSRFTLIVTDVHVHRLQDMDEGDAVAEGFPPGRQLSCGALSHEAGDLFNDFWTELHGPDAWDANPWVCAITFDVHEMNIDQLGAQS